MIKFISLSLRNFMSYGNNTTKIKLDFTKPTLIVGKNYDEIVDGQITSNGSGKSTLLNTIAFCAYDRTISNLAQDDLINYVNGKNMEVALVFEKDNDTYTIERYRKNKLKGGNGVKILKGDKDITPDSIANANKEIERIMGIPFEIFSRIVVFVASYEPFLSLPSSHASKANQRDIIEELFGLVELSEKAEKLKIEISKTKVALTSLVTKNSRIAAERDRYITQITSAELKQANWQTEQKDTLRDIKAKLKLFITLDFDTIEDQLDAMDKLSVLEREKSQELKLLQVSLNNITENNVAYKRWIESNNTAITATTQELKTLESIDVAYLNSVQAAIDELNVKITTETYNATGLTRSITQLNTQKAALTEEIAHLSGNLCPYCKQTFAASIEQLNNCTTSLDDVNLELTQLSAELVDVKAKLEEYNTTITPYKKIMIPANLKSIETSIIKKRSELDSLTAQSNPFVLKDVMEVEGGIMDTTAELDATTCTIDLCKTNLLQLDPQKYGVSTWTRSTLQKVNSEIDELESKLESNKKATNPFDDVVKELNDTLNNDVEKVDNDTVDELSIELEHQEFLLKLLTKKDSFVRKALLNKNIPFLNARLAYYLSLLGLSHKVLFTEEMGANINKFGTAYEFENLSSGQKARVNLALSFAFRDVLQVRFNKINFCILDECLDVGLDNVGVNLAAKMIKNLAITEKLSMLIISHKDEVANMFDKKLEVELRDGFSNILPGDLLLE